MELEIISTVLFIIFLGFELKQHILCWPIGIVSSLLYIYTQYQAGLLGMTALAIFLVLSSVYGWYQWGKTSSSTSFEAHYPFPKEYINYGGISLLMFLVAYALLSHFQSQSPLFESLIFTLNIIGTLLMAKKSMLAWIAFFISNVLCIPMYIMGEHYVYAGLYVIYGFAAILGWINWARMMQGKKSLL